MFPLRYNAASVALNTKRATCPLLVSASLRPSNARSHTLRQLPENPAGFSETKLNGAQRDR
jgi:hypothetical protein